jgi:hypothetical protein
MHVRLAVLGIAAVAFSIPALADDLPDNVLTPGVALKTVPDQRAATCLSKLIGRTVRMGDAITLQLICQDHYTSCIREVPTSVKNAVYASYKLPGGNHTGFCKSEQGCEVDHLISLELGGSNDQKNLWPQPYEGEKFNAHVKDRLEKFLNKLVCEGQISLATAQKEISTNWKDSFTKRISPNPDE